MTETIPGGAYRRADGTWVNAKGKRIAAPAGPVYVEKTDEAQVDEELTEDEITPGASKVDEFGKPIEPIVEGEVKKAKSLKTKKQ